MLELLFAIVVIGILAKFGVEFLAQAYRGFIYSNVNHTLQAQSEGAVELIAAKLQYRIKDSVIARHDIDDLNTTNTRFYPISDLNDTFMDNYSLLEWIGEDADGFRGTNLPYWSGIFDLASSTMTILNSPETNTTDTNNSIVILSDGNTTINDAALYFTGAPSDITQMGWKGLYFDAVNNVTLNFPTPNPINNQTQNIHPIATTANADEFAPRAWTGSFFGVDVYEYFKLTWSAYAVRLEDYNTTGNNTGDLYFYYDYQPWNGESYLNGKKSLLAQNISTFRFKAMGSLIKIQVCVKSDLLTNEEHSICKDKTVF